MAKLLCLLMCLLTFGPAGAVAQTVEGRVFDAATGAVLGGVKVELLRGATPIYETTTDGGGRFRFDDVRENDYAARYQSPDYWSTAGASDYRLFHVAAGSPVKLEARLMPWSKISGRVVDGKGKGVAKAGLELAGSGMVVNGRTYLRTSWGGGGGGELNEAPLPLTFRGTTDAQGKFEVRLMPGTYGLAVVPPPDLKPPDPEPDGPMLAWKRTFYPSVAFAEGASKIVVLPGEDAEVELKLLAVPVHAVRGVVLNPDGTPASKVPIVLGEPIRSASMESKPDGTFEFPAVAEGEWRLSAEAQRNSVKLRAAEWIDVTRHDVENVKLCLVPPLTIRGKVVMDGPKEDRPPARLGAFILSLRDGRTRRDGDPGLLGAAFASPDVKGEFVVQDVYPGVYRLAPLLQAPPPPYYLDAIRVGEADLTMREVDISFDTAITVVYKSDGGSVRGTAENCASGGVVLVPSDPERRRPGFSKSGPCDASGHYEVRAVRPGDYYALAFAGNGPVLALDESLLKQGVKVTVRAGEASSVDLRTITRPVY
jgi:hypothetical protein